METYRVDVLLPGSQHWTQMGQFDTLPAAASAEADYLLGMDVESVRVLRLSAAPTVNGAALVNRITRRPS
jgi:hypothetical protein